MEIVHVVSYGLENVLIHLESDTMTYLLLAGLRFDLLSFETFL